MAQDLAQELRKLGERAIRIKDSLQTEEAAKTSLVLPFLQLLGYDIFDPAEVVPEFDADAAARYGTKVEGVKKAEKIDYAIMKGGKPIILVECKKVNAKPGEHFSQLARYFHALDAKFAVLTNGIEYEFYTDLESPNKLDSEPFLRINLNDLRDVYTDELVKFSKDTFNVESIVSTANELKYLTSIRTLLKQELDSPSEAFVTFLLKQESIFSGRVTSKVVEQFTPFVKNAFNQLISDLISERLRNALVKESTAGTEKSTPVVEPTVEETAESKVVTTPEELEAFFIVKSILRKDIDGSRISFRDSQTQFSVLLDGKTTICRLRLGEKKKSITIPSNGKDLTYVLDSIDGIYAYSDELLSSAKR